MSGAALKFNDANTPFIAMLKFMGDGNKDTSEMKMDIKRLLEVFKANPQIAALFTHKPRGGG